MSAATRRALDRRRRWPRRRQWRRRWRGRCCRRGGRPLARAGPGGRRPPARPCRAGAPFWPRPGRVHGAHGAIVAMGSLGHPNNTFWQLFLRPAGATRWALVTPPGVADNGGLVADDGTGTLLTAGFEPTQRLTYSPVVQTTTAGGTGPRASCRPGCWPCPKPWPPTRPVACWRWSAPPVARCCVRRAPSTPGGRSSPCGPWPPRRPGGPAGWWPCGRWPPAPGAPRSAGRARGPAWSGSSTSSRAPGRRPACG